MPLIVPSVTLKDYANFVSQQLRNPTPPKGGHSWIEETTYGKRVEAEAEAAPRKKARTSDD